MENNRKSGDRDRKYPRRAADDARELPDQLAGAGDHLVGGLLKPMPATRRQTDCWTD